MDSVSRFGVKEVKQHDMLQSRECNNVLGCILDLRSRGVINYKDWVLSLAMSSN